ncbi:MAG: acetyl-coenzyme A synthetase N-terminal domain-containing protein, partial [Polymorphobacter sp.]
MREMANPIEPKPSPAAMANTILTRTDWETARGAVIADPGRFHGDIAARNLHWLVPQPQGAVWISFNGTGWSGWDATTAAPVVVDLPSGFTPWSRAFNDDAAPHFRWFDGARTNCCFNEVDRHVLAGHGAEAAFIFEGDRWDMAQDNGRGAPVDSYAV